MQADLSSLGPQCATKCGTFDVCATSATNVAQNVAQTGLIKHGEINQELYSHWFTYSSKI